MCDFVDSSWKRAGGRAAGFVARVLLCIAAATSPATAGVITSTALVNFTESRSYGDLNNNRTYDILKVNPPPLTAGAIVAGVGALGTASGFLDIKAGLNTFWFPMIDMTYGAKYTSAATWQGDLKVGDSFVLASSAIATGLNKINLVDEGLRANLALFEQLAFNADAKGCLGGCINAHLGLKANMGQNLVSINDGGNGKVSIFGKDIAGGPVYQYTTPQGELSVSAQIPNFSHSFKNVAAGQNISQSWTRNVLTGSVNVAQIAADLAGGFPVSGDLGGFEYTLLKALLGVGFDIEHSFSMQLADRLSSFFSFSSPVEIFDGTQWGAPVTFFELPSGALAQVRPAQPTKSLGVTPTYVLRPHIDADWDLVPFVGASITALELAGYGLHLGPLVSVGKKLPLTHLDFFDNHDDWSITSYGKAFNLAFDPLVADINNQPVDLCASQSCVNTGFVGESTPQSDGWTADTIHLVTNMTDGCALGILGDCVLDPSFEPLRTYSRPDARAGGEREFTSDLDRLLRIAAAPDLVGTALSNEDQVIEDLLRLGIDINNLGFPSQIGAGAPPLTEPLLADVFLARSASVPEPGMVGLVCLALIALAGLRSRQRAAARKARALV